jgi:His/Glu/Gln/Arg/opine family amino acid ABC transporter permease subunit
MADQAEFLLLNLPRLLFGFPGYRPGGLLLSILLAAAAIGFGFVIALFISSAYDSRFKALRWSAYLYIQIFRGIPVILLLLLVHQLLSAGPSSPSPRFSAVLALTLYSSAYQAEIVRAGLKAVPAQLVESARLLGSSSRQAYLLVQLRYAGRVMLPAFTGQAISLFKDTSVVVIIGVADLMTIAQITLGGDVGNAPYWVGLYLVVGALYFSVAFGLSRLARRWEFHTQMRDLVYSLANY